MFKVNLYTVQIILVICSLLSSCSSDDEDVVEQSFSLNFGSITTEVTVGESFEFSLSITKDSDFVVSLELEEEPVLGELNISDDLSLFTYTAGETAGDESFILMFSSETMSTTYEVNFTVVESLEDDNSVTTEPEEEDTNTYSILFPSDYLTIFEHESVTFDIKRNYQLDDSITETFYFNIYNVEGSLSDDQTSITLTAQDGNEDTYGEIIAVINVNGVIFHAQMYVIYFNKNRDLITEDSPLIALLDSDITIRSSSTMNKAFDVYDEDSDRIAYRILSAPSYIATHINKDSSGFNLTIYTIDDIDSTDNELLLEVSDAHNTTQYIFNLVETVSSTELAENTENTRPNIYIEENVAVSLIQKMDGTETDIIAELAFAYSDSDGDEVTISASASDGDYTFRINPPYVYVIADDVSDLQYEQITITASDGNFDSKLTYHLYTPDNYSEFLGGNPNTAPFTDLPSSIDLLETKTTTEEFTNYDFEMHDFEFGIYYVEDDVVATITDSALTLTASAPDEALTTEVTFWLEDIFGSRREHVIDVNIYKNSAPVITPEETDIQFIEQETTSVVISVTDFDESSLEPVFTFDETKLTVDYSNGTLTVSSVDLSVEFTGEITIFVEDEFGATDEEIITVTVTII
jgi:hypothetical protein